MSSSGVSTRDPPVVVRGRGCHSRRLVAPAPALPKVSGRADGLQGITAGTEGDRVGDVRRVVVWGTGWIGSISVRSVHARPDLDLVGVWVHSPDKVGPGRRHPRRHRGDRPGRHRRRRRAARPRARLRDLRRQRPRPRRRRGARLRPHARRRRQRGDRLVGRARLPAGLRRPGRGRPSSSGAADEGGATLYASGIEPGFAADQLPLTLLTLNDTVDLGAHPGALPLRRVPGGVHDARGVRLREAARPPADHGHAGRAVGHLGRPGEDGGRRPRRQPRRHPRDLRGRSRRPAASRSPAG